MVSSDPEPILTNLRETLARRYDLREVTVRLGEIDYSLLKVSDTNKLVDQIDPTTFGADERLPYWGDLWTSAIALAEYCVEEEELKAKSVLEIGCGLGLVGMSAARSQAQMTMTDYEPDALHFARYNACLNLAGSEFPFPTFKLLDWRDLSDVGVFDIILAADVVYERRNFAPLVNLLSRVMACDGYAIFAEPGRSIGADFLHQVTMAGFTVEKLGRSVRWNGNESSIILAVIRHSPYSARALDA